MKVTKRYPILVLTLSAVLLAWSLPTPAGAASSEPLKSKAKSSPMPTNLKPKAAPGASAAPSGLPSFKPPARLPQGAAMPKIPNPQVGPGFGKSIQRIPEGVKPGEGLGQGKFGKGLPGGMASPKGVLGRTPGVKGPGEGSPPSPESLAKELVGGPKVLAGPGGEHSPVQSDETDQESKSGKILKGALGKAMSDMGNAGSGMDESAQKYGQKAVGEMNRQRSDSSSSAGKTSKSTNKLIGHQRAVSSGVTGVGETGGGDSSSDQCDKGQSCGGDKTEGPSTSEGTSVVWGEQDESPSSVDPAFLKKTKPPGVKQVLVADEPAEGGEGGQPSHIAEGPIMVNPGPNPQDADLPPGTFENLNKNLQRKILSGEGGPVIMDPPK